MDAKGRLSVPVRYREHLLSSCEGRLVVTVNDDMSEPCLLLYPLHEWEEVENKISRLPSHPKVKRLQRLLIGNAREIELDGSGRILLPPELRKHAGLEKKIRLVGIGHKFEIWGDEQWTLHNEAYLMEDVDERAVPEELLTLSL